jgi:hypothetical protein
MSENESGESRTVGAFLLGFLTGVLVCLGAGGALFLVSGRTAMAAREEAVRAEMEAMVARDEAMRQAERAAREAARAREQEAKVEKALRDARDGKGAEKKDKEKDK